MRDPKRIDRVLNKLKQYWEKNPDLRLGQILINANKNGKYISAFYMEDDEFEAWIENKLEKGII